jgi:hypothetical protein
MTRQCEVCTELGVNSSDERRHHLIVEQRLITLCGPHARLVKAAGADSLQAVRALFREFTGRRSALPRRAELDRRAFPPRPEGRRLARGRRARDIG